MKILRYLAITVLVTIVVDISSGLSKIEFPNYGFLQLNSGTGLSFYHKENIETMNVSIIRR